MLIKYTIIFLALFMLASCSSDTNESKENTTEEKTQEIADKAVATIQVPLDRARKVAQTTEEHYQQVEETDQKVEE